MTSKPVAQLLVDLGVARSHSRPHVSNDNPYSEAAFKTGSPVVCVGHAASFRPGRSGRCPPSESIASAMSASGDLKPSAIRVRTRILMLVDSISAFVSPCSSEASISARCRRILRPSLTNIGIRQRCAHFSHRSRAALPASPAYNTDPARFHHRRPSPTNGDRPHDWRNPPHVYTRGRPARSRYLVRGE